MRDSDRTAALDAAIVAVSWCAAPIPAAPSRYTGALNAARTATKASALSGGGRSGTGSIPKGTISDPTGSAAIRGLADTEQMQALHTIVLETCWCIRSDITEALYDARLTEPSPLSINRALTHLEWATVPPHTAGNAVTAYRQQSRFTEAEQLDHSIDRLARDTRTLTNLIRTQLGRIARSPKDTPQQRPLVGCTSCKRDGDAWEPVYTKAESSELCRWCYDYRATHGHRPPVAIVKMHRQGRRISTADIARATGT